MHYIYIYKIYDFVVRPRVRISISPIYGHLLRTP